MSMVIYLIAGEASGDALGAGLMRALRQLRPDIQFAGIGGDAMAKEGLRSLFPYQELSIMGFWEVLPHLSNLLRRLREAAMDIAEKKPAVVITIDSPGFNFRLAKILQNTAITENIKRIHYVAPSVWAYKPQRAKKTAQLFNGLLALLPFEPPYFEKEGLPTTFVGHPVFFKKAKGNAAAFRARHHLGDSPVLLLLPGSRKGEVKRHLSVFMQAARSLSQYKIVIIASPAVKAIITTTVPNDTIVVDASEKDDAFASATMALSKSGTITLELAVAGVPMIVSHRTSLVSAWLIRRMILIQYASLVNIAANKEVVPELLQERCNVDDIKRALTDLAVHEAMEHQKKECAEAIRVLRGNSFENPDLVAAQTVLKYLA